MAVREARLRPEWADLYPGVVPDIWQAATDLVPVVLRYRMQGRATWEFAERVLVDEHFEFRGGRPRDASWGGILSRVDDP